MQFVPLWTSILRSRKVAALPDDLYRTWTLCLLTAQEHDHKHGSLPPVDDFSYALHMEAKSLMSRLSRLVTLHFIDVRDGIYYIHDWDDWKHRPDPTGAARKRAQREREREQDEATYRDTERNGEHIESENVTVTAVTSRDVTNVTMSHPNSPHLTSPITHPPLPPETGDEREQEPFESLSEEDPPPIDLPADKMAVFNFWGTKFSSSNGDRVICDLLNLHAARVVSAACEFHFLDGGGSLDPRKLGGICRAMTSGRWKIPEEGNRRVGSVEPAKPKLFDIVREPAR